MRSIAWVLRFFNTNPVTLAAALIDAEIDRRSGFHGPISPELEPLSKALDCLAAYREVRRA